MKNRVVVTGMGVVSPNGVGKPQFLEALKKGKSGIRFDSELEKLGFLCRVAGTPGIDEKDIQKVLTPREQRFFTSTGILYALLAGFEAWEDAGLEFRKDFRDPRAGTVFGKGVSSVNKTREVAYAIDEKRVRKLRSNTVPQTMGSGPSAYLSGKLGLGNWVTSNSSACTTGSEAVFMAFEHIRSGRADRMLAGSCSDSGPYIWGPFDALRVTNFQSNDTPENASRPMSAHAMGFVPAAGAGALVLESLESARDRGAEIYAEILGGALNCGAQVHGGSMMAPNSEAIQECIQLALKDADVSPAEIEVIDGHLTATAKDPVEIENWAKALGRSGENFPYIHSLKSMIGHCIAAAGSVELVGAILGMTEQFLYPSLNCEELHPDILKFLDPACVPTDYHALNYNTLIKANFGFGDVNCCLVIRKFQKDRK